MVHNSGNEPISFQQRVKKIAEEEWESFDRGQKKECDEGGRQRVADYWQVGVGITDRDGCDTQHKWSAAFISWIMKKAGAGDRFKYNSRHSVYIRDAIQKRNDPNAAFKGYRLNESSPQVGDLVCFSSGDDRGKIDYDTTRNYESHCDLVVATRPGEVDVIGGNVQASVSKKTYSVNSEGYLLVCNPKRHWFVVIQNRLQSSSETQIRTSIYPATVKDTARSRSEHCSVSSANLAAIGGVKGCQIRVKRNDNEYALYTVSKTLPEPPEDILLMGEEARSRLGINVGDDVVVDVQVPHPSFNDATAKDRGEFVERLTDDSSHTGLVAIAPHGGAIEQQTDKQVEYVVSRLASKKVSGWCCKGWRREEEEEGKAYKRWHITSTDIHEASFPCLNAIIDRNFKYSVSFHGFLEPREADILIGGRADSALKQAIQQAIQAAVSNGIVVNIPPPDDPLSGTDRDNIVNRLSVNSDTPDGNGIQIEQSKDVRRQYWRAIAEAVASVYDSKLP